MDLFENPKIFGVTELTRRIRALIEESMGQLWVEGEVCNFRRQASGHQYFGLKDEKCVLPCVLFYRPGQAQRQVPLADGMQVQVRGQMTVYEARGQYQLNVNLVQAAGVGLLQARFEALKRKLQAEGFFNQERKRPLPRFPATVGIVTSPTGAAVRDMLNILGRRAPWVRIVIHPVRVQGLGAAAEMASAINDFNRAGQIGLPEVDVIVACRGGGSAEDLWEFNEEVLARAIFASDIPVVSAVGHEIDFTISDFVADLRAPTPSAAAELIVPDMAELKRWFNRMGEVLERSSLQQLAAARARVTVAGRSALFLEPQRRIQDLKQRLDWLRERLDRGSGDWIVQERRRVETMHSVLRQHRPDQILRLKRHELSVLLARLHEAARKISERQRQRLGRIEGMLRVLAPQATLERGYSMTMDESGKLLQSVSEVRPGGTIRSKLRDGEVVSRVLGLGETRLID